MELSRVYDQHAHFKDPYDRLKLQGGVLEEMKDLKERIRQDLSLGTPKPYRNRALSLYRSLEPHMHFSERGELYDEDGRVMEDSRVEDLVQHAVRDRRRDFVPRAWDTFVGLLKKHNVPRGVLNRATLQEMDAPTPQPTKVDKRLSYMPPFKTPKRLTRSLKRTSPQTPQKIRKSQRRVRPSLRYPSPLFLKDFSP